MLGTSGSILAPVAALLLLGWEWLATRTRAKGQSASAGGLLLGSLGGVFWVPLSSVPFMTLILGALAAGLLLAYARATRGLHAGWAWIGTLSVLAACAPTMLLSEDVAVLQAWGPGGRDDLLERLPQALVLFSLFPLGAGATLSIWDRHPDRRSANRTTLILGLAASLAMMLHALRPFLGGPR